MNELVTPFLNNLPSLHELRIIRDRRKAAGSLAEYAKMAWPVLEPETPLMWGWALDEICNHLEAVTRGEITRLKMNVPPGMMKSLLTGVIWPTWEWGPRGMVSKRILGTAHKQDLAVRDNMKARRLVTSRWYQDRWPIAITSDSNAKGKFENVFTGFREAMAFTSMTGSRGDRVILDDPHSVDQANSVAELKSTITTFREALPTRINNKNSAIVVIMQRLHELDVSGVIEEDNLPYVSLVLPMRFEADRKCVTPWGGDRRTKEGELLFPERFDESQVRELEMTLGSYATAGQLQQRPAPRGGGTFARENFVVVDAPLTAVRRVRAWDLAATEEDSADWTVGLDMGVDAEGRYMIYDVERAQLTSAGVLKLLKQTAARDGRRVKGSLPKDPGQAGKSQVEYLIKQLAGYPYTFSAETGSKEVRASPLAAQVEIGNVYLLNGPWVKPFLDEISVFPAGRNDDQVDAASRAFNFLNEGGNYTLRNL